MFCYLPEFKKARAELKKRSTDTLRLQKKKARKGQVHLHVQGQPQSHGTCSNDVELNRMLESSAAVVQEKRLSLEETERKAVRAALLEERGRFCLLARFLKPVLVSTLHRYFYRPITIRVSVALFTYIHVYIHVLYEIELADYRLL